MTAVYVVAALAAGFGIAMFGAKALIRDMWDAVLDAAEHSGTRGTEFMTRLKRDRRFPSMLKRTLGS